MKSKPYSIGLLMALIGLASCNTTPVETPLTIRENPEEGVAKAKAIRENTPVRLAEGLNLSLWASDSLAPDPVAMSIDDFGRVYLNRTNRQKNSEFDIRGHKDWMTASIGLQTVEDRRAFLKSTFAPEKSNENKWLKDVNQDGVHDWRDLAVEKDEIWKIEDISGDGIADVSTRVVNDFHEEITDVAGGVLIRKKDMFVTIGPDLWRMKDTNGDGVMDQKESISHGYAVHIGFSGHGMSGVIEGPDGKLYWNIGDIGANITTKDGKKFEFPNEGIIARSNPDGSDFEVFAAGLRNTHEFVFDEYGNLVSCDNDGDHPGERERLVHIVEGSDAGWRANWQYGKYTDPRNNSYKVWMDENLHTPRWEGQAAYIIPPIVNFHNGPTGMVYNPGTALGSDWKNKYFVVEFVGDPSRSHVWSFDLKPKGASFEFGEDKDVLSGILPTGIRFGPDGALYIADWINGWDTKNYGRVWKMDVNEDRNDWKDQRAETKKLMQLDYEKENEERLLQLLSYGDMRIRQKAQFELAERGKEGAAVFEMAITQRNNQLARIHGIWGIGQLAAKDKSHAGLLLPLLKDGDNEIVAQAAKVLGDIRYAESGKELLPLLAHANHRVRFFAAQSLGRMAYKDAVAPLVNMIDQNNDEDLYVRHAGVLALSRIGEVEPMVALATSKERDLRIAAVLVLRRLKSEKVAIFLKDADEYVATEAARAINDDLSITGALPALASALGDERYTSEALLRRAINACLRVGGEKELELLVSFARRTKASSELRAEALATLGTWPNPSVLDRVDGRYRGKIERDPAPVKAKIGSAMGELLKDKNPEVLVAISNMLTELGMKEYNGDLAKIMKAHTSPEVRSAMVKALSQLQYPDMAGLIKFGMEDKAEGVRTTAISLLGKLDISKENLPGVVSPIFTKGTISEQQQLLKVLGKMKVEKTGGILEGLIAQLTNKKLSPGLALELFEAVDSTHSQELISKVAPLRSGKTLMEEYSIALYGGNANRGRGYFNWNSTGQCVRCHSIRDEGGKVGPSLRGIGKTLTREQILQAMIEPSARLSPGFGTVKLTLKDGSSLTGTLMKETQDELTLKTSEAEPLEIAVSRIAQRENMASAMPPMGSLMSKSEVRDMVEFLANQKE